MLFILFVFVFSFSTNGAHADIPATPRPVMVTSKDGGHLFKMIPGKSHWDGDKTVVTEEPFGIAYELGANGELIEKWRTDGWYAFEVFLSNDGRYLARIGLWASDWVNQSDLAIAFYDRGKLVKRYEVHELIKDPDTLSRSVSHYTWRPVEQTTPVGFSHDGEFNLVMIDKTAYTFDPATGKVMEEAVDPGAKTYNEIFAEEEQASEAAAKKLYEESSFREDYDEHFRITELDTSGHTSGVHFQGAQWSARLLPKKKLREHCEVSVNFPVDVIDGVETTIKAIEIETALKAALEHPWVAKRFEGEPFADAAYSLRLRITGDRLHWKSDELREQLGAVGLRAKSIEALRPWAYFIVDAHEPRYTSLYLNVETGDIVFEDPSTWPREILRFDSKGNPVQAP